MMAAPRQWPLGDGSSRHLLLSFLHLQEAAKDHRELVYLLPEDTRLFYGRAGIKNYLSWLLETCTLASEEAHGSYSRFPKQERKVSLFFLRSFWNLLFCIAGNPSVQVNPDGCSGSPSNLFSFTVYWFGTCLSRLQSHRKSIWKNPETLGGHSSSFPLEKHAMTNPQTA